MALMALVIFSFRSAVADWNDVPTASMVPTILEGDRIFVNKLAYDLKIPFTRIRLARWGRPERGDVVVFFSPTDERRWVKRVVGLPGDRIELRDNRLYVNGERADYDEIDDQYIEHLDGLRRVTHEFATETVEGEAHPIMISSNDGAMSSFDEIVVPDGKLFLMGDNRDNSMDSRVFGCIEMSRILGEAKGVALSVDPKHRFRPRWSRFFSALP